MAALWGAEGWERCECTEVGQEKSGSSVPSVLVFTVTGWSRLLEASFLWLQNLDLGSCVLCDTLEVLPLFPPKTGPTQPLGLHLQQGAPRGWEMVP